MAGNVELKPQVTVAVVLSSPDSWKWNPIVELQLFPWFKTQRNGGYVGAHKKDNQYGCNAPTEATQPSNPLRVLLSSLPGNIVIEGH